MFCRPKHASIKKTKSPKKHLRLFYSGFFLYVFWVWFYGLGFLYQPWSAEVTQKQTDKVVAKAVQGLTLPELAALPGSSSLSGCLRNWRYTNLLTPSNPTSGNGFGISVKYATTLVCGKFLLYDSGVQDSRRKLIFGTHRG